MPNRCLDETNPSSARGPDHRGTIEFAILVSKVAARHSNSSNWRGRRAIDRPEQFAQRIAFDPEIFRHQHSIPPNLNSPFEALRSRKASHASQRIFVEIQCLGNSIP